MNPSFPAIFLLVLLLLGASIVAVQVRFQVVSGNVPRWFSIWYYNGPYSTSDIQWWADHADILIGQDAFAPTLARDLKTANPNIKVLYYIDAIRSSPAQGQFVAEGMYTEANQLSERAFTHRGCQVTPIFTCTSPNRITSCAASNLCTLWMNPGDETWQRIFRNQSISVTQLGRSQYQDYRGVFYNGAPVDGIMADDASAGPYGSFLSDIGSPVEYPTLASYASAIQSFWLYVNTAIKTVGSGKLFIPNICAPHLPVSSALASGALNGYFVERAPSASDWDSLNYSICGGTGMVGLLADTKSYPSGLFLLYADSSRTLGVGLRAHILDLALWYLTQYNNNVLMGYTPCGYAARPVSNGCGISFNSTLDKLNIGIPMGDAQYKAGLYGHIWTRLYSDGIVISKYQRAGNGHADTTTETIQLNRTYVNAVTGLNQSSVILRNGEAFIGSLAMSSPVPPEPVSTLTVFAVLLASTVAATIFLLRRPRF